MSQSVVIAWVAIGMMSIIGCTSAKSSIKASPNDLTVDSIPSGTASSQDELLKGNWGLVDFTCQSGHAISPIGATLVHAKSTILSFNNGVMRLYSSLGACSFVNYNIVAVSGDQLIYRGGHAFGKKECQGLSASKQGISADPPDSFALQDDGNQLVLRSQSNGDICPQGDTIIANYSKLTEL